MADVLTQLQTCYDQLLTQMFATLSYLHSHHPYLPPRANPSDRFSNTQPLGPNEQELANAEASFRPYRPDSPETFSAAQRELARDLVLKERQIEELIKVLPGIGSSEREQEEKIRSLVEELRAVEELRKVKRREARELMEKVEGVVMDVAGEGVGGNRTAG